MHFLLPLGGAMVVYWYWYVIVFRAGPWSNLWSFKLVIHFVVKLQQFRRSWRYVELCRASTATPFSENSVLLLILHQQPLNYFFHYVWGTCDQVSKSWSSKLKTCDFHLPLGGALPVGKNLHITVFRAGPWSNLQSFVKIGWRQAELWQLPVSWRMVDFRQAPTATPFNENSGF